MVKPHLNFNQFIAPAKQLWSNAKGLEMLSILAVVGVSLVVWQNLAARGIVPRLPLPFTIPYIG